MLKKNDSAQFHRQHALHTLPAILIIVSNKWRSVWITITQTVMLSEIIYFIHTSLVYKTA